MAKYPIYLVTMETRHLLASTFMRFQEYYESPEFRNKIFTREEYEDWYAQNPNTKSFSYYSDWSGFNIPSWILTPFYDGTFDPLTQKETALLNAFTDITDNFYIIGTNLEDSDDKSLINHEFVHGLYYILPDYKKDVDAILAQHDITCFYIGLQKMGYIKEVCNDETNAYCTTGFEEDLLEYGNIDEEAVKPLQIKLHEILQKHLGYSITQVPPETILESIHQIYL